MSIATMRRAVERLAEQIKPAPDREPPKVIIYVPWNFRDGRLPPYDGGPVFIYDPGAESDNGLTESSCSFSATSLAQKCEPNGPPTYMSGKSRELLRGKIQRRGNEQAAVPTGGPFGSVGNRF